MIFEQNVDLQSYNTLALPSSAEYFYAARSEADLIAALSLAQQQRLPVRILGGGSNVLLPETIPGLVLHPAFCGIECVGETSQQVLVRALAANNWHQFVCYCLEHSYYGLENLSFIPGNVGAAPIQNIGAYGLEVCERVAVIETFDCFNNERVNLKPEDCDFVYRDSVFKSKHRGRYIILAVQFRLNKQPSVNIEYPALAQYFANKAASPTPQELAAAVVAIRKEKLPDPEQLPNAGSFFKNPIVDNKTYQQLKQQFPELVAYAHPEGYKLAAAWLIDQAGWKGKPSYKVEMHRQQALVLTNPQRVSLRDVMQFAELVQNDIDQRFGVVLEIEPQVLEAIQSPTQRR